MFHWAEFKENPFFLNSPIFLPLSALALNCPSIQFSRQTGMLHFMTQVKLFKVSHRLSGMLKNNVLELHITVHMI